MKKETRTLLIVLGIVTTLPGFLALFIVAFVIFVPQKWIVRMNHNDINRTVSPYPFTDTKIPDDPVSCSDPDLRLYLAGNLEYAGTDERGALYTNAAEGLEHTTQVSVKFSAPAASYNDWRIRSVYWEEGIWAFHCEMPKNAYEVWDFILNLTEEQFDERWPGLLSKDARAGSLYVTAMGTKEKVWQCKTEKQTAFANEAYQTKDIYHFENETAQGFVILREKEEAFPAQYALELWLFDKNDLNRSCRAILFSGDIQLLAQIANTAEIVPNEGDFDYV